MATDPAGISTSDPGPQSAAADGQSMAAHSLSEQIKRAQFLALGAAKQTRSRRGLFGFGKFIPAGCTPDRQATGIGGLNNFNGINGF